jgi:O-6-methylguanine DNA methyltransferase
MRTEFAARVLAVVRRIPAGRVSTYGDVAAAAGKPRAARAVGNIMRTASDTSVPYHRVIAAGGKLGGYGHDLNRKRTLLRAEGVMVVGNTIKDFKAKRWGGKGKPRRHEGARRARS